jgi:hypothetical protein
MTAAAGSLIARLRHAGATLTCSRDGRVHFAAPAPVPADLLAQARQHRDAIARLLGGPADLGTLPAAPCSDCGCSLWWRVQCCPVFLANGTASDANRPIRRPGSTRAPVLVTEVRK